MAQAATEGVARGSADAFVFHSCRRCSLTRAQERRVFLTLALLSFAVAIAFAGAGYWLVLPFAGLEIGLLAWALDAMRGREGDYETLKIDGDRVVLEWRLGSDCGRREMNRQWVHVECACTAPGRDCRLAVRSHGRETELGRYLSDEARMQLAATLRGRLGR